MFKKTESCPADCCEIVLHCVDMMVSDLYYIAWIWPSWNCVALYGQKEEVNMGTSSNSMLEFCDS